ncbi:hypothetical protein SEPCBS119000_006279 [Sporothrix epigloea]|uniref:Spermine/spermidine synthase n=1 Tax=Sporothrix epigloea TaxID=1892477 RepID=A0ABP0E5B6_9PEZI
MPPKPAAACNAPPVNAQSNDFTSTSQDFERDLTSLAGRARGATRARVVRRAAIAYGRIVLLLTLAAASANASVAALSPVFGAIPAGRWHFALVASALFTGWSSNLHLQRLLPPHRPLAIFLPLLAAYVPAVQYVLSSGGASISTLAGPRWGPVVIEALTLFPLLAATAACVATEFESATGIDEVVPLPRWIGDALPGIGSWAVFRLAESVTVFTEITLSAPKVVAWLTTRVASQLALATAYCIVSRPSRLWMYAVPAILHAMLLNSHLAGSPWALALNNRALQSDGWVVLDRRESITGYVSVIENLSQGFRVLRCDHSLLGGEWTRFPANPVAEPVYGVFVMLEAVRLVNVPDKTIRDADASCLVVGLGIGTAPAAFVAHGIDTTVVELDPVVHEFASRYFHLPANHKAVLEDAVSYTDRLVAEQSVDLNRSGLATGRFDYIVHDVFTGGAEPIPLFTLEFLQNLHALLKPSGVIAINYAGDLALTPIKAVMLTIRAVFPACRIFREHERRNSDGPDFTNCIVFCIKQGKRDADITFRAPLEADLLRSNVRKQFLMPKYEVFDADFRSTEDARIVRRNDTAQLTKHHAESALGHWAVMRQVVPAKVWELW